MPRVVATHPDRKNLAVTIRARALWQEMEKLWLKNTRTQQRIAAAHA